MIAMRVLIVVVCQLALLARSSGLWWTPSEDIGPSTQNGAVQEKSKLSTSAQKTTTTTTTIKPTDLKQLKVLPTDELTNKTELNKSPNPTEESIIFEGQLRNLSSLFSVDWEDDKMMIYMEQGSGSHDIWVRIPEMVDEEGIMMTPNIDTMDMSGPMNEAKVTKTLDPRDFISAFEHSSSREDKSSERVLVSNDLATWTITANLPHLSGDADDGAEVKEALKAMANWRPEWNSDADRIEIRPICIGRPDGTQELGYEWLCQGKSVSHVPANLKRPSNLQLTNSVIEILSNSSLVPYQNSLRDFSINNAPRLTAIEPGTFSGLKRLRVINIQFAPKLVSFDLAIAGLLPDLRIIRIQQAGLKHWPDLSAFTQEKILSSIDLAENKIVSLGPKPITIQTHELNLAYNQITFIDEHTFDGSTIAFLSLNKNRQLNYIYPNAFANIQNLIKLDLSYTSISELPVAGLHQLRTLVLQELSSLKNISSILTLPQLKEAHLTYAHHCCYFRYSKTPVDQTEKYSRVQAEINAMCASRHNNSSTSEQKLTTKTIKYHETSQNSDFEGVFESEHKILPTVVPARVQLSDLGEPGNTTLNVQQIQPTIKSQRTGGLNKSWLVQNIECGELAKYDTMPKITCTPEEDAFNPCEDIMGYPWLRFVVWLVVGASVCGNLLVIVVTLGLFRNLSVPKFLQLNLAIGDLFMGVYLAMIAIADITTKDSYFDSANQWQHGYGCMVAGAVGLFASQSSIFSLSVITFERYYTITYSIHRMRLTFGWAARIMFIGWLYAFVLAMLPVFADVNSYSKSPICLPLRTNNLTDRIFILVLLIMDSIGFIIIFTCYLKMYLLISRQKIEFTAKERTVARRIAMLVTADSFCWGPVIILGTTALFGYPLINLTICKAFLVCVYPFNSVVNPYLYYIFTKQYRKDLNNLISRWRIWRKNLFRRNDNSYYSNNAYGASQYVGSLNPHLGTIAAVTGVANHLRNNHTGPAIKLTERREISSKTPQGEYVIRHQIVAYDLGCSKSGSLLNSKQLPIASSPEGGAPFKDRKQLTGNRSGIVNPSSKMIGGVRIETLDEENITDPRHAKDRSTRTGNRHDKQTDSRCLRSSRCKSSLARDRCYRCCRCCSAFRCLANRSERNKSSENVLQSKLTQRSVNKSTDIKSGTMETTVPEDTSTFEDSVILARSQEFTETVMSNQCSPEKFSLQISSKEDTNNMEASNDISIDILGNLSCNEPTSSVSGVSSPREASDEIQKSKLRSHLHRRCCHTCHHYHHRSHRHRYSNTHECGAKKTAQTLSDESNQVNESDNSGQDLSSYHCCHHRSHHRHHRVRRSDHRDTNSSREVSGWSSPSQAGEKIVNSLEAEGDQQNIPTIEHPSEQPKARELESILKPAKEDKSNQYVGPLKIGSLSCEPDERTLTNSGSFKDKRGLKEKKRVFIMAHHSG